MRSKNRELIVNKARQIGPLPGFIELAQRHFEKAVPDGEKKGGEVVYPIPVDTLLVGGIIPQELIDDIESIEVHYRNRAF